MEQEFAMQNNQRREELLSCISADEKLVGHLVDEIIYLEDQIAEVKKLPFIKVHPNDPQKQKSTPAARLYVQLNAQYNSAIRTLVSIANKDDGEEESPLRAWIKKRGL